MSPQDGRRAPPAHFTGPSGRGLEAAVNGQAGLLTSRRPASAARSIVTYPRLGETLAVLRSDPRQAIRDNRIWCLICGDAFRQLTNTHLRSHSTTPAAYKDHFGYNRGRPLMCRELLRLYAERAVRSALAEQIRRRPIIDDPELRRLGGARIIALEERLTRWEARQRRAAQRPAGGEDRRSAAPTSSRGRRRSS